MGFFNRKKKPENFDNLPYLPDDDALPPLPTNSQNMAGFNRPHLPPLPKKPMETRGMPQLDRGFPPLPKQDFDKDLPPMPKFDNNLPPLPKIKPLDEPFPDKLPDFKPKLPMIKDDFVPMEAAQDEPTQRKARVFVQLKKYQDIVSTVGKMEGRINDLQNSLDKIKDIRAKEGELLDGWNKLLGEAKSKIEDVNKKLPSADDY